MAIHRQDSGRIRGYRHIVQQRAVAAEIEGYPLMLPGEVELDGVKGKNTDAAWATRFEYEKPNPGGVLRSLAGIDTEKAWELREGIFPSRTWVEVLPTVTILESGEKMSAPIYPPDDYRATKKGRAAFRAGQLKKLGIEDVAESVRGLSSPRARAFLERAHRDLHRA